MKTSKENKSHNWGKYLFEFLSIFIAVITAFALNNWNENRRDRNTEINILTEISNGFEKDLEDVIVNKLGHQTGIDGCKILRKAISNKSVRKDSLINYTLMGITRDFISLQNTSGYESLKSKGLEIIENDSLRFDIISLYEYDFKLLKSFEEEYSEMQFHKNYFNEIIKIISPNFIFDSSGNIKGITLPLKLEKNDKKRLLIYLLKIEFNRKFILDYYSDVEEKVEKLNNKIKEELKR